MRTSNYIGGANETKMGELFYRYKSIWLLMIHREKLTYNYKTSRLRVKYLASLTDKTTAWSNSFA